MAYNLLIVDDSSIIRKMIKKALGMTTMEIGSVLEAENGLRALELLGENWVDLVFLDINMPVMNGVEFIQRLRSNPDISATPVVIVSTEGSQDRIDAFAAHDVKAYLRKPVTPEKLTETVQSILGGSNHGK